ncbi:alkyl hydroperoxide reductase/ Thiol specific antioxidant/ Mal allergen [mine drainage metagenome]|uniref:Alkyl hydroperoxide reductase/ Thiol specific antioxidant/ Mal allergen n=1 Tax=mine drainage metagenome TaxID=410659 RepID=T1BCR3_9ZZZZ
MLSLALVLTLLAPVRSVAAPRAGSAAPNALFLSQGRHVPLAAFHGKKVMLWLFSTWCPSCQAGLRLLARKESILQTGHVHLVVLENDHNGGYPGPSMQELMNRYARLAQHMPNWTVGQATRAFARIYNPKSYPDIYYLIRRNGEIEAVGSAPSAHLEAIEQFARGKIR